MTHIAHKLLLTLVAVLLLWQPAVSLSGDTLLSFAAPQHHPQGLAFDGAYLWNADRMTDMFYKIDPADGSVIDSLPTPGYVVRGITSDGTRLWCVDAEEELIYAVDTKTRVVMKTIFCPVSRPRGLAWDGNYLWICDDGVDKIHQISSEDGTTIVSLPAPTSHPCGLAFDGTYLWVSDRYRDEIYMVSPESGDVIITVQSPGPHCWGLAFDGEHLWNVDYQTDRIYKLLVRDNMPFDRTEEKSMQLEFIHQLRNFGPDSVKTLDVYLAIPHDMNNQELIGDVTFQPQPSEVIEDKWGQKVAHFHFDDLAASEFTSVSMAAEVTLYQNRYYIFPEKVGALEDIPADIREAYLVNDTKFSLDHEVIQKAVKAAIGIETNPYWIARKIYNYVIDTLSMNWPAAGT